MEGTVWPPGWGGNLEWREEFAYGRVRFRRV